MMLEKRKRAAMTKVLIMEDSAMQALMLADWFELDGHETHVTNNAADALECLLGTEQYDLLVTDVFGAGETGDATGAKLIETLRDNPAARIRDMPIISISGLSFETKSHDADQSSGSDGKARTIASDVHFLKPIDVGQLSRTANELIAAAKG